MNLKDIQIELEADMVSLGAARYWKEVERGLAETTAGKDLRKRALIPMAAAIEEALVPKRGRPARGLQHLRNIDPHILADLTMRRVLDCAAKEESVTKTCKAIAAAVEWHVKDAALRAASVSIWNKTQERLKKTQDPTFRRHSIDGTVEGIKRWAEENSREELAEALSQVKGPDWDINTKVEVGSLLIDLFARSTGLIVTEEVYKGRSQSLATVKFSEGTEEWLQKQHAYRSLMRPIHLPMVVPPKNWCDMQDGGYLGEGDAGNSKSGVKFIKTKARNMEADPALMQDAFDAVNLIQRTGWRVNLNVYHVMERVYQAGSKIGGVPPRYPEQGFKPLADLPPKYVDMTPEQRAACKDKTLSSWRQSRREAHTYNSDLKTASNSFAQLMDVATRFAQFPAFYHPHKLDWRQRAYPISMFLSPQGDQFNKGLIEFAEGKRIGDADNAPAWLAIHGANCYGIDKVSFEERIEWVQTFEASILESALFPFETAFWQQADKPWPFLAFCFEWLGYRIAGDDYETHLPVALDGANSGLQHLSAMLRDPEGARVTCVQPGPQPEDVYQMVADAVEAEIQSRRNALEHENYQWNDIWAGKVSRKVVKQPTMTYTYSATESGMRNQIANALRDLDVAAQEAGANGYLEFTDPLQNNADAAAFLAPIVRGAIKTQMVKAAEAMDFLVDVARVYSKTGNPLRWTTPVGVPVVQYYPTSTSVRKEVFINGTRHQLRLQVDAPDRLDKKRAAAGVSPNFVHSMDSTHLLWTVLNCNDEYGITDFAMIHDSFGTHATACDELAYATRAMFVALYDEDRLAAFHAETVRNLIASGAETLIDELPPVPTFGTFNVESVMDSAYFFA